ncbi:hypothetical protein [Massilia sp. DD77]|uniref:hypothetical protein n=1 Tax=Massilia sp. DD77 TaxID=3109349 RepID=UPI002FFE9853
MPLLSFWESSPNAVLEMSIEQIVTSAGDGVLKDESLCSKELRTFFAQVPTAKLGEYAAHCLNTSFSKSGLVLQDLANELGGRLGFKVTHGLYQGTTNGIGNDGLWHLPGKHDVLVEVKTTDAYRIRLDKIAAYRDKLLNTGAISKANSMLIVVGRDDTGELEAQVRGSRHAWDMRLISVDALFRLVDLKEQTESEETANKIRELLVPFEYTRLDRLIDVMFTTAKDAVETVDEVPSEIPDAHQLTNSASDDKASVDAKREQVLAFFAKAHQVKLIRNSRALYWNDSHTFRVACGVSKRYTDSNVPYWYAFHLFWHDFLIEAEDAFYVLGCLDLDIAFAVPFVALKEHLSDLDTSTRPNGTYYWHIRIMEPQPGTFVLQLSKTGKHLALNRYLVSMKS